jgi:hypothetical protein
MGRDRDAKLRAEKAARQARWIAWKAENDRRREVRLAKKRAYAARAAEEVRDES